MSFYHDYSCYSSTHPPEVYSWLYVNYILVIEIYLWAISAAEQSWLAEDEFDELSTWNSKGIRRSPPTDSLSDIPQKMGSTNSCLCTGTCETGTDPSKSTEEMSLQVAYTQVSQSADFCFPNLHLQRGSWKMSMFFYGALDQPSVKGETVPSCGTLPSPLLSD